MTHPQCLDIGGEPFGIQVQLTALGAAIFSIQILDDLGEWIEVTVGPEKLEDFAKNQACFGATCGRFANRIARGRFTLEGGEYQLDCNNGPNSLHGGSAPFHARLWELEELLEDDLGNARGAVFSLKSPDGDGGYPGELSVRAIYRVTKRELSVVYEAWTDAPTVVNLTNHVYLNLSCGRDATIKNHLLKLSADQYFPVDDDALIVPVVADVTGTPFDFRDGAEMGQGFSDENPVAGTDFGYDHPFLIRHGESGPAAILAHEGSGLMVEVRSNQPALQIYAGFAIDEAFAGKGGSVLGSLCGVAIESQNLPDAPNQAHFPSSELRPGETYRHEISWRFDCQFDGF